MIGDPQKGTAILDVAPDVLAVILMHLPKTFSVIGSDRCETKGCVRLVLESDQIAPGYHAHMACEVSDAGCTRTVTLRCCGPAPSSDSFKWEAWMGDEPK